MPNKTDEIITEIIKDEGGSKATNDPKDKGGRTQYGIAEASNPKAWEDGKVTEEEAREIYFQKYVKGPGFHVIPDSIPIKAQLIDFGVNSGPGVAIMKLQGILGVEQDGVFGPFTVAALAKYPNPEKVNNLLVVERVKMIGRIVQKNPSQVKFLSGWINRAFEFMV